jgi:hypothetical protein
MTHIADDIGCRHWMAAQIAAGRSFLANVDAYRSHLRRLAEARQSNRVRGRQAALEAYARRTA